MLNVFTDGASKGNPGKSGIGIAIYEKENLIEEHSGFIGKKTNSQAEYEAVIFALKRLIELNEKKAVLFSDSEFLIKQINGLYKVKAQNIKPLYEQVLSLLKQISVTFIWIGRDKNTKADELANKGVEKEDKNISVSENISTTSSYEQTLFLKEKAFFGKINCLKVQLNHQKEIYFHMGLLDKKTNQWNWEKVKMSDVELGELVHLLKKEEGKCSFYHAFGDKKTQIWCNKSPTSFSIKIKEVSKNMTIGEIEVLRIFLEQSIYEMI